jgi:SAM-dependent methyltransferase
VEKVEFDEYSDNYRQTLELTLTSYGGESLYYAERKLLALRDFISDRARTKPRAVMEFGCGIGINLPFLRRLFTDASLHGVDVSKRSLQLASELNISNCQLTPYDGSTLPFIEEAFDLVVVFNVLHHIDPIHRLKTLEEISRCIEIGALLMIVEHNPYNFITRKLVRDCPFDNGVTLVKQREVHSLLRCLGYSEIEFWNITFIPSKLKIFSKIEKFFRWLPLGAQYAVFAVRSN